MHDTALKTGEAFFKCYGFAGCSILDVGSADVNGTLRQFAPENSCYTGVDFKPGPGVDLVIKPRKFLPFEPSSFDLVVSTSCFEHDPQFWVTFYEMCRVINPGGFIYLSVPSNGIVHRYPVDCWRFYPDSGIALAEWVNYTGDLIIDVVESFQMSPSRDGWIDQVSVFGRRKWNKPVSKIRESLTM